MSEKTPVALWYHRYGKLYVEWFDDDEAAAIAWAMEETGSASVAGIQNPDGTFIERDDWPRYQQLSDERSAEWSASEQARKEQPPAATWLVRAPVELGGKEHVVTDKPPPGWPGLVRARTPA